MAESKGETIIPKTEASKVKLDTLVQLVAPHMFTEVQATVFARALTDFTEQAIKDDRARIAEDITALGETDLAVHFVLQVVLPLVTRG